MVHLKINNNNYKIVICNSNNKEWVVIITHPDHKITFNSNRIKEIKIKVQDNKIIFNNKNNNLSLIDHNNNLVQFLNKEQANNSNNNYNRNYHNNSN